MPTLRDTSRDDPVAELSAAQQAEVRARYDGAGEPGVPPSAQDVAVALVAVDDDGAPVGCGALRPLEPGAGQVERRYVGLDDDSLSSAREPA